MFEATHVDQDIVSLARRRVLCLLFITLYSSSDLKKKLISRQQSRISPSAYIACPLAAH